MPPKKEQQQLPPYKPYFVLPIFFSGPASPASSALGRPVNIKKNIDTQKIIEILKDKGLDQYLTNGQLTEKGRQFACSNLKTVCDEFITSINKPADPKKDAKKDAKKEAKKEQVVVQNPTPPIEINFEKSCNDFFFFLTMPQSPEELQIFLSKQIKLDIVVIIKQKVKPGSRKPNYQLLNHNRSVDDMQKTLKQTSIQANVENKHNIASNQLNAKKMVGLIKNYKLKIGSDHPNRNLLVVEIIYFNDLSNPEKDDEVFINSIFQRICKCTKDLDQYVEWKSSRKLTPMIQPLKQIVKKQVQVEQKNDKGKKGGKPAEPVFQTVQEVIEKRYQDMPEHIKSDLKNYHLVKSIKSSSTKNTRKKLVFQDIQQNCIDSLVLGQKGRSFKSDEIKKLAFSIKQSFESQPINKMAIQNVEAILREINSFQDHLTKNKLHFDFQPVSANFSYGMYEEKSQLRSDGLRVQYLMQKVEELTKSKQPKLKWSFADRFFIQKLSEQQINGCISNEILFDPQIFSGSLQKQKTKLLVLSRTNPPGRVLYHNSIFDWKVLPDYQNWYDYFLCDEKKLKTESFLDYSFNDVGNLSIKTKSMMPTDNTIIRDTLLNIGSKTTHIIELHKQLHKFGLTKKKVDQKQIYMYWHKIGNQNKMRIFKSKDFHGRQSLSISLNSLSRYTLYMSPYLNIHWENAQAEKMRRIQSHGEITCFYKDGSISIYKPEGEVSTFRNGKWKRINNQQYQDGSQVRKVEVSLITEGDSTIKIRQDQTIIISYSNGNKKIIFPDGTQIYEHTKQRKRQIKTPNGPLVRIYLSRDYNLNVIGYGSAFAYLGFNNIRQRSYDGYLFQVIDFDITYHFYTERFEKNKKIETEEVKIVTHRDSSMFKISSRQGNIVFISPTKDKVLTSEVLNQKWLQLFTTVTNHGQGVFDIDLNLGQIQNKDIETNRFVAKMEDKSEAHIAVSFITEDDNTEVHSFPDGFHIQQQNYFLPPPSNKIPPRVFVIDQDGSGAQYLNKDQIGNMEQFTVSKQRNGDRTILQYCKQIKPSKHYRSLSFSEDINLDIFGLPDILNSPETRENLIPTNFYEVKHRIIQQVEWNNDYSKVRQILKMLEKEKKQKIDRQSSRNLGSLRVEQRAAND